jgi:hypothetical protein
MAENFVSISTMRNFIIILLLISSTISVYAQSSSGISSDGRDFYIGLVYPGFNKNPGTAGRDFHFFSSSAWVTSFYDSAVISVSYFLSDGKETEKKTYVANHFLKIPLDINSMRMTEPGDTAEYKACHITATVPVSVTYYSYGANSGGSYLALPTSGLGKEYVVPSYYDNPGGDGAGLGSQREPSSGFFLIIGAFDSTKVVITPNTRTAGGHVGVSTGAKADGVPHPYSIILQRGQCYWVKGDATDNADDISSSLVIATKPIGLLAGHEDALIGEAPTQRILEGRDFMIEQVIPTEVWDTMGYVSIPLAGALPVDETSDGYGQNYRVYANQKASNVVGKEACTGDFEIPTSIFAYPVAERKNLACPVEFHSANGRKFSVMCYEQRDQGTKEPFPAECMMSIVPMSRWRKSYSFYVPASQTEIFQDYFINIIGEYKDIDQNILFSFNGGTPKKLSVLSTNAQFKNIPNYPELKGIRYRISPGFWSFINRRESVDTTILLDAKLHGAFMVYSYAMRAFDPDGDLGDFDGDDYFFANANPAGMSLASGDPAKFSLTVDSQCTRWNICVKDLRKANPGIRSLSLLNDTLGIQFSPGKKSFNCHFDPLIDPVALGEVELPGTDSTFCFTVFANDPFLPTYAALMVTDNVGNEQVIELRTISPKLLISPTKTPINFGIQGKGNDTCLPVIIKNIGGSTSVSHITSLSVSGSNLFSIKSIVPALPVLLNVNDSIIVNVCFTGSDTNFVLATLTLGFDCFTRSIALSGQGTAPMILASDIDFGDVDTGSTSCKPDTIRNIGASPLVLDKNFTLGDKLHFTLDNFTAPLVIPPGGRVIITICYTPTSVALDTSRITWLTNENNHAQKDFSILRGRGSNPSVVWNVNAYTYFADTNNASTHRFYLLNKSTKNAAVDLVRITGADSNNFTIIANQLGFTPLSNFPLKSGDSIWVDIRFSPYLTGAPPERYVDRHAQAIATSTGERPAILNLTATYSKNAVVREKPQNIFTIHPNPANGNSIIISFDSKEENAEVTIFDVLGREMLKRNISNQNRIEIPIRDLQNGIYYARVISGGKILTEKFEVMR